MVATHIKNVKHSMLCVTGVYFRDITNIIIVLLHLNNSRLSVCSSSFVVVVVVVLPVGSPDVILCG